MDNKKVSSEKGTDVQKKRGRPKKTTEAVIENVAAETKNTQDEIALLKEQIRLLQEANAAKDAETKRLLELSARVIDSGTMNNKQEEKTVPVKCLELNGVELSSPNRDTIISLPYDVWVDCNVDEVAQILKKISNRSLFEDGICIMPEEGYKQFKLKPKVVIDMDKIVALLDSGNEQDIVKELNYLTNDKKNLSVSHLVLYAIVGKSLDGELDRIPRASIETLEMYFGIKLRDCETLLKLFRVVKE